MFRISIIILYLYIPLLPGDNGERVEGTGENSQGNFNEYPFTIFTIFCFGIQGGTSS